MHHGQDLIDDQPLVQTAQELADADEAVDANGEQRGRDAELLDPGEHSILHGLVVKQTFKGQESKC